MKSTLIVPIAISGAGKSLLGDTIAQGCPLTIICPDDIRRELTGSVSNQSQNEKVFSLAYDTLEKSLRRGGLTYFSATNLSGSSRGKLYDIAKRCDADVINVVLLQSLSVDLCKSRVKKDLQSGIDRSDTLTVIEPDAGNSTPAQTVIDKQYGAFLNIFKNDLEPFGAGCTIFYDGIDFFGSLLFREIEVRLRFRS